MNSAPTTPIFIFLDFIRTYNGYFDNEAHWSDMKRYIMVLMALLAVIGIADSAYLTLAHYGIIGHANLSLACNLGSGGCNSVLNSPNATLFGIPNSELGLLYFSVVLGAVAIRWIIGRWVKPVMFLGFLTFGLCYSVFLLYDLFFVLGVPCPYCILAHTANGLMFFLYIFTRPFESNLFNRRFWPIS